MASLAADAGRADDVKKYSDQIAQIDPASPWTQRVMALKAALPVAGVAAPAVEAKKADAAPDGPLRGAETASTKLAATMQRFGELSMEVELMA